MRPLSRRAIETLGSLREEVRRLGTEREAALRRFHAARVSTTRSAQVEFWLEFAWLTEEYRFAVRKLSEFCVQLRV